MHMFPHVSKYKTTLLESNATIHYESSFICLKELFITLMSHPSYCCWWTHCSKHVV